MKILKLANQSGITVTKKSNNDVSYEYLADFAQAVIEEYKAGLMPVGYMVQTTPTDRHFSDSKNIPFLYGCSDYDVVYALGETK